VAPFPGATADRAGARYVLAGAPLDVSTSFRPGTRFGPDRVRQFARPFDDYDRRTDAAFSELAVHDAGDLRAWPDAGEYLSFLRGDLSDVVDDGAVPLVVGGEHTVTAAGAAAVDPDVLVVVDAHLDLRSSFDGDPWSHACVTRRVLEGGPDGWPASADRAVVVGARTGAREEWERADAEDVTVVGPADAADWSPSLSGERAYLSVDVDGFDPAFAPGTGTLEPFGLAPSVVRDVVRAVAPHAAGFDVVEVNDRDDGQAAALGGKLLREFVYAHAAANGGGPD
jgi:agmatinase